MNLRLNDEVSFRVRGTGGYLDLQAEAIRTLNRFFGRDVLTTHPQVNWTLRVEVEAESMDGKVRLWCGEVEAFLTRGSDDPESLSVERSRD